MRRRGLVAAVCAAALTAALLGTMPAAHAGGSFMSTVDERHEPGDVVTMIGYTSSHYAPEIAPILAGTLPPPELRLFGTDSLQAMNAPLAVMGRPLVEATGHPGDFAYRVSFAFRLPRTFPTGYYAARFTERGVGDIVGGQLTVGIDLEPSAIYRTWAFNEPAIARLTDDKQITVYPVGATVGELRRGVRPPTDAWLRQPVKWPLPVVDFPAQAIAPSPSEVPVTTIAPVTTTVPVTTAAPTTVAPTTILTAPTTPTDEANDAGALIVVAAIVLVFASAVTLLAVRARRNALPTFLAQSPQDDAVKCADNGEAAATHDAEEVASVS